MSSDFLYVYLGLINAVDEMNVDEDKEEEKKKEEKEKEEKEGPKANMDSKLQSQLKELEAEHADLTRKGRAEDAAFIAAQIKELQMFIKENEEELKELLDSDNDDESKEEYNEDDLSIDLSDKEDMDVDKVAGKRKAFNL